MIIGKKCCVIILNPRHFNLTWHLLSLTQSWLCRVSPLFAPPENSWGLFLSQDTIWLYTCVWCCSSSTLPFASDSSVSMNHCYHMSLADEAKSDSLWHCWQNGSLSHLSWVNGCQQISWKPHRQVSKGGRLLTSQAVHLQMTSACCSWTPQNAAQRCSPQVLRYPPADGPPTWLLLEDLANLLPTALLFQ